MASDAIQGTFPPDGKHLAAEVPAIPQETLPAIESAEDLAKRFAELAATLLKETGHSSKLQAKVEHPAFREIVAMGERAVPLILAHTEKHGGFVFLALREITGTEPPIPEGHRGNRPVTTGWVALDIRGMQAAWLAWGREKGYRWEHAV